ncbi:thioester-containing protein 1 allele S3-like [Haematobia irritans]|uniref:thioester-containing protein 1 allele S3-like n=1 Tax=Haematobia irritans TaxID=7368 RepID=UPI003F4FF6FF
MKCICILTFLTIYMWDPVSGESHYTIIAPGIINTNRKYTVAVAIHESNGPSSIKISINGPLFNVSQEISLRSYETEIVQFNVTELEETSYYLEVVGKGGIEFQNSSKLIANPYAAPNVHIQTDAIIYKPGDLVNFRVIIFDEDTRPFQTNETINVEILDGNSNSINKFSNIHLHKGIYEGNFSIAQYPPLGVWMILVTIGGQYGTTDVKTITVDHYELPEFAVYIEGSRHAVLEDGVIRVKVYGKYTYDRYVKGTLKTYLKTDLSVGAIMEEIYSITNTIDVEFKFDPKRFSKKRYILITAELKEENTGVTQTNSFEIVLHTQLYRISVDRLSIVQLNNATYQLKAKVTYWNETHVEDPGHVVIMEHGTKQYKAYLDEKSEATFEYEHVASANYTFHFGKSSYSMKNIMDINVYTEDYKESLLTLNLLTKRLVFGVPIQIEVKSDNDIPYFFYTIVSHGNIVQMDYIKVSGTQKNKYDLQIMPTIAMVPALFLYVHYIQNGKLHYKEMLLKFPLEFENKISLESPKTLQPGEKVNLTIKAQKNSRVCLMAVDKRVYLSNSRFDINIKDIWRKLQTDISYLPTAAVQYPGKLAGVITLTNAHFNYVLPKPCPDTHMAHILPRSVDHAFAFQYATRSNRNVCVSDISLLYQFRQNLRLFYVREGNDISSTKIIRAGVPQGSVMGPILYILFTSDLPQSKTAVTGTFADDTAVLAVHKNANKASDLLQNYLNELCSWLKLWRIKANESKSTHITFTLKQGSCPSVQMNQIVLPQETEAKYLGLYLDNKLNWKHHIKIKRKAVDLQVNKMNYLIGSNSKLSLENKLLSYKCIIKPIWTYGIQLWGTASNTTIKILQQFQSKTLHPKIDIIYDLVPERWLRRKFPNTWIFQTLDIAEEETQLTLQLPDTITTWRLTAFSLHEDSGFGIVNKPINILVTKVFFIHLDLPYSVKLGEMFLVPITIVSNHNESIVADITVLPNDEEYIIIGAKDNPKKFQKTIDLSANGIETIEFSLIATKIGEIFLKVVGQSDLFTDAIERKLLVEPEGSLHQGHRIMYIDASAIGVFNKKLFFNIPTDIVPDSEYIAMYIGGDTLMPSIESIRNSIRMPTGNGEENMVKFVSSILIMDYLISMDLHSKAKHLVDKAKLFLDMGYQQQLAFCHSSGGYSTFGQNEDSEASTWLTAHTVRFFIKAQKYLGIRDDMIERGLDFLATNQRVRGDFLFTGKLSHPPGQNLYGFTSFVLLAFFEDKRFAIKYNTTIQNALKFLTANIDKVHNIYDLSLVAHILQKAEHPMFSDIWPNILEQQNEMGYRRWWLGKVANMKKSVEITSYVLMTQLALNQSSLTEDHDILRWLLEQCDQMNGIASAHNTVLRLEALAKFSEKYSHLHDVNMSIRYTAKNRNHDILDQGAKVISSNMSFNLQTMELPKPSRTLDIEANGMGHVLLQVSYRYHKIDEDNISPNFHIQPKAEMKNIDVLQLEVCFSYESFNTEENLKENLIKTYPSMIIMEVNFPSGFMASHGNKYNISKHILVKKIESKNHEGSLIIYIQRYEKGASGCFHFEAHRRHHVKQIKRAAIVIYDSYNLSRHDTVFYDCPLDKVETVFRFSSQTEDNQHTSNNPGIEKTSEYRQTYLGRSVNDNTDGGTLMDNPHENNASHTTLLHRASENMFPLKFSRSPKSFKINGSNFMGTTNGEPYSFDNLTLQLVNLYPLVYKGGSQYFQINEGYKLLNSSQMLMDICFQYKNKYFEKDEFNSSYIIMQVYLPKEFKIKKVQPRDDIWQMGKKSYSLHNFESEVIIHFGNLATNESRCINITSDILAYGQFSQYGKIFIYDIHNLTRYGITNITNISEKLYGPHEKVPTLVLLHDFKDQMANFESIGKNDTNETTFYNSNRLRVIEEKISHLNDEINKLTMEISYLKESTIKDSKPINGKYRNPSMSTIEEADSKLEFKLNSISNDIVVIKNEIQKIFNRIDIILEEKVNIDLPSADQEIFRTNEDPIYLKRRSVEVEDLNHAITNISQKLRKSMGNMPIEINELKNVNQQNSDEVTKLVAVISKIKQDLISLKDDNQKMRNEISVLNQKILEVREQTITF